MHTTNTSRPTGLIELAARLEAATNANIDWRHALDDADLFEAMIIDRKLAVIARARDAGLTWPELAEAIDYGTGDDRVKAGKALHAWATKHRELLADEPEEAPVPESVRARVALAPTCTVTDQTASFFLGCTDDGVEVPY